MNEKRKEAIAIKQEALFNNKSVVVDGRESDEPNLQNFPKYVTCGI